MYPKYNHFDWDLDRSCLLNGARGHFLAGGLESQYLILIINDRF